MSPRIPTYTLTEHSSLPCISHFASLLQNNLIAWKGYPRCLYLKTKRALNSLLLYCSTVVVEVFVVLLSFAVVVDVIVIVTAESSSLLFLLLLPLSFLLLLLSLWSLCLLLWLS